jgi:hypothetical protein
LQSADPPLVDNCDPRKASKMAQNTDTKNSVFGKQPKRVDDIDAQINQEFAEDADSVEDEDLASPAPNVDLKTALGPDLTGTQTLQADNSEFQEHQANHNPEPEFEVAEIPLPQDALEAHEFDALDSDCFGQQRPLGPVRVTCKPKPFSLNGLVNHKMTTYEGLRDKHLQGFFYSKKRKEVLVKNGLITMEGYIIRRPDEYLKKKEVFQKTDVFGLNKPVRNAAQSTPRNFKKPSKHPVKQIKVKIISNQELTEGCWPTGGSAGSFWSAGRDQPTRTLPPVHKNSDNMLQKNVENQPMNSHKCGMVETGTRVNLKEVVRTPLGQVLQTVSISKKEFGRSEESKKSIRVKTRCVEVKIPSDSI